MSENTPKPVGWRQWLRDLAVEFVESGAADEVLRVAETGLRSLRTPVAPSTDPAPEPEVEGDANEVKGDAEDELTPEQRRERMCRCTTEPIQAEPAPPLTRAAVERAFLDRGETMEGARRISATLAKEFPWGVR